MLLAILGVIVASLVAAMVAWYIHYQSYAKYLTKLNGPTPLPLVGNAMVFKSRNLILQTFDRLFNEHGKIMKLMLGVEPVIAVADYKAVEAILSSNKIIHKASFYRFFYNWLNFGLLTSAGSKWKQRRRILTPTYHFKILEQFVPVFNKVSNMLVEEFGKEENKDCVDVYPYITLSTLDVICETAMGVSVNAQLNKTSTYVICVKEMGRVLMDRSFHPSQQFELMYKFTANYRTEKECLKILHGHTMAVIKKRKEELAGDTRNQRKIENGEDDFGTKKRVAFLDMLLQSTDENGLPLSDEDIREEVDTFMFEGHDTTASGISFGLFAIANNPHVQQKILEEQQEILNGESRDFTFNDLNQMKYLEMVIRETLRLYPSVPMFGRQASGDFKLIVTVILSTIIAWYIHYFNYIYSLKNVNGPMPVPILGSALEFKSCQTILGTFENYFKTHGKIVKIMLGIEPVIVIADYKAMESVLSSNKILRKSQFYRFLHKWLNLGLLTSAGLKWKQRRRILTPTYHFQILEQFVASFAKVSNILVEQLRKEKHKDAVDVYPYVTLSTLDVICETAMGVAVNAQLSKTSAYVTSVKEMGRIIIERVFNPNQQFPFLYRFTENYKSEQKCLKIIHGHTKAVIRNRRELVNSESLGSKISTSTKSKDDFGVKKRVAFLDLLLQCKDEHGEPLSDEAIQEEVDTFMFEGHDTTASGISFALYAIANHPEVQNKILQEQQDILGQESLLTKEFTYSDLNKMRYLEMVIKESLRLYPSVPFIGRQTTEEFKLTDDVTLSAGYTIMLIISSIQRDPEYFQEPDRFDPDRFLHENKLGKPYSFVPFSAGSRNCIGQKFAYLEMKMTLSNIVRHFELSPVSPVHKLELSAETILKSDNGIVIKMKERNSAK